MDVKGFVDELLRALTDVGRFEVVSLQVEGPVADGYAYVEGESDLFLRVYYNEMTGTLAFALIDRQQRIWGIDYDNRRGWHLHPAESPADHIDIAPLPVSDIIVRLQEVLLDRAT